MKRQLFAVSGPVPARRVIATAMTLFVVFVLVLGISAKPQTAQGSSAPSGDPIRGKELFSKRCGGCHALDSDKEGPRLRGVYGRKAGSVSSFKYSDGLKSANFTWDAAYLDRWLTNTESVVQDNDMDFHVPRADERADIIAFLRASSIM